MPNWNEVLKEIQGIDPISPLDIVRRKYLAQLSEITGRNTIAYYSGWLQNRESGNTDINDDDKNSLMATIHKLPRENGLDLILHTPGGELTATESIVHYLRQMFGINIRVIIPQIAMSAGTMIACSAKEIIMGKQSNIGPIDPQFGGIPAHGVIDEFETAIAESLDPIRREIWKTIISKYHPTFIGECRKAIDLSSEMVKNWLITGMFNGIEDAESKASCIVDKLNEHSDSKTHSRHIHIENATSMGLKILTIEDDCKRMYPKHDFQDTVLTIHHAFMHTFAQSKAIKIIENHIGSAVVQFRP